MPDDTPRRCLVALCHNWPVTFSKTAQSLMELGWGDRVQRAKDAHGFTDVSFAWFFRSPRVDALRDMAAVGAIKEEYSHVLFLDADMVWPSDLLVKMLGHHSRGIVSGLYIQKFAPHYPIALINGHPHENGVTVYQHDKHFTGTDLRAVEVVGMGCTLVPTSVFGLIGERPWFTYENDADGWPMVSEDVPFCRKAAAAGIEIWLDPAVKCGHAAVEVVTETHWRRWMQSERASEQPISPQKGSAA